ncbi:MAG: DNA topoisomerase I [Nanoarchaeota archaeon]
MPPRKPKHLQKSKAETTAENYFPVDETMVKRAVEKEIKPLENIEKIEVLSLKPKEKKKRKTSVKKTKAKTKKGKNFEKTAVDFIPEEISLKKNGYELIITEKPQAAMKIASALGDATKRNFQGIPYYEVSRDGKKIVVACAVGHLFTLKQMSGKGFPVFDIKWIPNFLAKKSDFTGKYYDTISKLAKEAGEITVATDYDVEGEVIGMNVVRFICGQKDANRMKFSTLTDNELNIAYEEKSSKLNWGQAIAGETRHYLDWFYGINLSRALMSAIKSSGRFKIMSIGRVQGPALKLIVDKEKEIQVFKSEKYWQVFATIKDKKNSLELKHNKDIFKKTELKKFDSLVGKTSDCTTEKREQILPPNPPFDLTTLQTEAYRLYGLNPSRTLQIAQSLYLGGLISYPRTSSQKLPDSIAYRDILEKLADKYKMRKLISRTKPIEGKKSDPAHPSIYPTGNFQILSGDDERVYDLIVRRFLSLFCDDAIIDKKTVKIEIEGLRFSEGGSSTRKKAWLEIYPMKIGEKEIPDFNGEIEITKIRNEEKETQPPRRYTQASILSELEKRNLGTKATRASILETLYYRGYVMEKSVQATELGISLVETLEKYSPIITDEKLTRDFEKEMENISQSKSGFLEKENQVIEKAKETITKIANQFEKNEKEIGKELVVANDNLVQKQREENILGPCPKCKEGNLIINYSKKTRRFFIACNAYPNCKNTYTLPPNSLIKNPKKNCEKCNFPMVLCIRKAKRPWILCFNSECEKNKERLEEYRKKKAQEEND